MNEATLAAAVLRAKLQDALAPERLEITDDSAAHIGHGADGSHLSLHVVSGKFANLSAIDRHRLVYNSAGNLATIGIHALSITALAPGE